jgi:hypothetical protein
VIILFCAILMFLFNAMFDDRLQPTHDVTGRVLDSRTGRPLPGVRVASEEEGEYGIQVVDHGKTDRRGAFRIGFHDSTGGTLRVEPSDHAQALVEQPRSPVDVLTDPLPRDHSSVRSGCIATKKSEYGKISNRFRLPLGESHAHFRVEPDSSALAPDLALTWPVGRDSSLRFDAFAQGGVRFDDAASFPRGADLFAVTCEVPATGFETSVLLARGANGMLFLRTADGARYAKIRVTHGLPYRIWYNPSGGTGLCSGSQACDGD